MINKKFLALGVAAGLLLGSAHSAMATDVDVDAQIITRAAISLTKNTDMDFGAVDFDATHGGSIQLGTDGTVILTGATGLTLGAAATTAGDVDVAGDGASVIDITCETGGTLTDGGANSLTLSAVEITTGAGGAPGAGTACGGLGVGPISVNLGVTPTPTILMGATLDVTGNAITASTTYDTTLAGGDPVTLRVVYQ